VLATLEEQALLESVMRPRHHLCKKKTKNIFRSKKRNEF